MQSHSTQSLDQQLDALYARHISIRTTAEAQQLIEQSLGTLPEPAKSKAVEAFLHLLISCKDDSSLRRKIGAYFCLYLGDGEFIPAAKPSRKRDHINF